MNAETSVKTTKDEAELKDDLQKLLKEQFKLKMQHGSGQLAQNHKLKDARREVARLNTAIHALKQENC